jgi:signal transduction histidine kinase
MSRKRTLRGRMLGSYMAVVAMVVVSTAVANWLLTPTLFARRMQAGAGGVARGAGPAPGAAVPVVSGQIQDAYGQALTTSLVVSAVLGLAIALVLAYWVSRRTLVHLSEMQRATGRLAAGDYQSSLKVPMEAELASLATSINSLGKELAATEENRARLVSDLAHELRNPLATIEGYMEGLIDEVIPATPATYSTVAEEAHRLQRLTQDLSLLSRVQEGRLELHWKRMDLGDLIGATMTRLRPQFEGKGVTLIDRVDGVLEIFGDADRLDQALTNVIGNALTHTPAGGRVTVEGALADGLVRVVVTDTGSGIPSDQLETIFQRFTRLDPEAPGTGIGLNIARSIVRLHGGDLSAHSPGPGRGSSLVFVLPSLTD